VLGREGSVEVVDQSLSEQAREAVFKVIIKSAPTVGNSRAGVRDLAEAYALLERDLVPNAGVVQTRTCDSPRTLRIGRTGGSGRAWRFLAVLATALIREGGSTRTRIGG
jgi:hypothetical protein